MARRLVEMNARKREEKLAEDEELLQKLLVAQDFYKDQEMEEYQLYLNEFNLSNYEELEVRFLSFLQRFYLKIYSFIEIDSHC